jgi:hypothetical protein
MMSQTPDRITLFSMQISDAECGHHFEMIGSRGVVAFLKSSVASHERRSTAGVTTTSPGARAFISFLSCGRSAVVPVIFS